MFRVCVAPIIRNTSDSNCSFWYRSYHRLRVFENGVLRRIFGSKWEDVTREWRKQHN